MGDLISRKYLLNMCDAEEKAIGGDWDYNDLRTAIELAPAVDAVPVVRCKHCVYGEPCKWPVDSKRYYCTHPQRASYYRGKTQCTFVLSHEKNHYCDSGKRREEEQNGK